MTDQVPDTDALSRVAAGDQQAIGVLLERHGGLARAVAFRVLRNPTLAEDAAQEAFVDLWRTAAIFDAGRASVRTWLCVLVHRRAVDLARREARRRIADGTAAELDVDSYSFDDTVVLESERRRIRVALDELNARNRRLIELSYFGGLTQREVAEEMDLPLGTVKSSIFQALGHLRTALAA